MESLWKYNDFSHYLISSGQSYGLTAQHGPKIV